MSSAISRRASFAITAFALLLVLVPFLFWYETWFGRGLSDAQLDQYFADAGTPRHAQHALVQVGERMARGEDVSQWYSRVIEQASSSNAELRQTAAWLMGQGRARGYAPFRGALTKLLDDPEPMVRRNAALALAGWGESAARPVLLAMLEPFAVTASTPGRIHYRVKPGQFVDPGTVVAYVDAVEQRAPVPGRVEAMERRDGSRLAAGDPLVTLAPGPQHVWESLRALYLVGQGADAPIVERYTGPVEGMRPETQTQAALTLRAIASRAGAK